MKKIAEEWLLAAKDDLDVIVRIIDVAHLSHIVAFHAQQCIEKSFKALMEEHDLETPKIHNLVTIYGRLENLFPQRLMVPQKVRQTSPACHILLQQLGCGYNLLYMQASSLTFCGTIKTGCATVTNS